MHRSLTLIANLLILTTGLAGQEMTVEQYIQKYSDLAVREMIIYHIPASITLAQAILESGTGNSELALKASNHFGIKCQKEWYGKTYRMDDDEKDECFRKYDSPEDSFRDHSLFLTTRERYSFLFDLEIKDYKAWATGLKQAGYATNPRYAEILIRIIEENQLYRFDGNGDGRKEAEGNQKPSGSSQQEKLSEKTNPAGPPPEASFFCKWESGREIYLNNKVKFIFAKQGDTWEGIAREFGIYGWQVRKYNELKMHDQPKPGEKIYLERKRKKGSVAVHEMLPGETLRNISQDYGVKLSVIYRLNGLEKRSQPPAGTVLKLR